MLNPVNRAASRAGVHAYKVEPYVWPPTSTRNRAVRRGGWTWYTGAAGWLYRAGLESILGLTKCGDVLHVAPCIPPRWSAFGSAIATAQPLTKSAWRNPHGVTRGVAGIDLDGVRLDSPEQGIALRDDGQPHRVKVVLG